MSEASGLSRQRVIRRLQKAGFSLVRDDTQTVMSFGERTITIPPADPIDTSTLRSLLRDAGLEMDQFDDLGFH